MEIRNNQELINALNPVIDQVMREMADEILDILYDYIDSEVYDKHKPHLYDRTEEFLNSWVSSVERKGRMKEVIATIYNSPKKMRLDTENYIHGSPTSHDFRQYLAQSIEEGLGGHYWFPVKRADGSINPAAVKRPFFSETINYLKKNGKLFSLFEKKMANHGLLLSKGNSIGDAYLSATAFM